MNDQWKLIQLDVGDPDDKNNFKYLISNVKNAVQIKLRFFYFLITCDALFKCIFTGVCIVVTKLFWYVCQSQKFSMFCFYMLQ